MKSLRTWKTTAQSYLLGNHHQLGSWILKGCSGSARASLCTPDPDAADIQEVP